MRSPPCSGESKDPPRTRRRQRSPPFVLLLVLALPLAVTHRGALVAVVHAATIYGYQTEAVDWRNCPATTDGVSDPWSAYDGTDAAVPGPWIQHPYAANNPNVNPPYSTRIDYGTGERFAAPFAVFDQVSWYMSANGFLALSPNSMCPPTQGFCSSTLDGYYKFNTDIQPNGGGNWPLVGAYVFNLDARAAATSEAYGAPVLQTRVLRNANRTTVAIEAEWRYLSQYYAANPASARGAGQQLRAKIVVHINGTLVIKYAAVPALTFVDEASPDFHFASAGVTVTLGYATLRINTGVPSIVNRLPSTCAVRLIPMVDTECPSRTTCAACVRASTIAARQCSWCPSENRCVVALAVSDVCLEPTQVVPTNRSELCGAQVPATRTTVAAPSADPAASTTLLTTAAVPSTSAAVENGTRTDEPNATAWSSSTTATVSGTAPASSTTAPAASLTSTVPPLSSASPPTSMPPPSPTAVPSTAQSFLSLHRTLVTAAVGAGGIPAPAATDVASAAWVTAQPAHVSHAWHINSATGAPTNLEIALPFTMPVFDYPAPSVADSVGSVRNATRVMVVANGPSLRFVVNGTSASSSSPAVSAVPCSWDEYAAGVTSCALVTEQPYAVLPLTSARLTIDPSAPVRTVVVAPQPHSGSDADGYCALRPGSGPDGAGMCPAAVVVELTRIVYGDRPILTAPPAYGATSFNATARVVLWADGAVTTHIVNAVTDTVGETTYAAGPVATHPRAVGGVVASGLAQRGTKIVPWSALTVGAVLTFAPVLGCPDCHGFPCDAATNTCQCDLGFAGARCDACLPGRYGPTCAVCPACVNNGTCDDGIAGTGRCRCVPPHSGRLCAELCESDALSTCDPPCNDAGGYCLCGKCQCTSPWGWTGAACEDWRDPCLQYSLDGCRSCVADHGNGLTCDYCVNGDFRCVASVTQETGVSIPSLVGGNTTSRCNAGYLTLSTEQHCPAFSYSEAGAPSSTGAGFDFLLVVSFLVLCFVSICAIGVYYRVQRPLLGNPLLERTVVALPNMRKQRRGAQERRIVWAQSVRPIDPSRLLQAIPLKQVDLHGLYLYQQALDADDAIAVVGAREMMELDDMAYVHDAEQQCLLDERPPSARHQQQQRGSGSSGPMSPASRSASAQQQQQRRRANMVQQQRQMLSQYSSASQPGSRPLSPDTSSIATTSDRQSSAGHRRGGGDLTSPTAAAAPSSTGATNRTAISVESSAAQQQRQRRVLTPQQRVALLAARQRRQQQQQQQQQQQRANATTVAADGPDDVEMTVVRTGSTPEDDGSPHLAGSMSFEQSNSFSPRSAPLAPVSDGGPAVVPPPRGAPAAMGDRASRYMQSNDNE